MDPLEPVLDQGRPALYNHASVKIPGATGVIIAFHIGDWQVQFENNAAVSSNVLDLFPGKRGVEVDLPALVNEVEGLIIGYSSGPMVPSLPTCAVLSSASMVSGSLISFLLRLIFFFFRICRFEAISDSVALLVQDDVRREPEKLLQDLVEIVRKVAVPELDGKLAQIAL